MKKQEDYTYEELLKCHGKRFKAEIEGQECEGKITVEGDRIYLCQNLKQGWYCREKHGYKCSWVIAIDKKLYFGYVAVSVTNFELIEEDQPKPDMTREDKIKLIQDYTEYFAKAKEQGIEVNVFDYVDSLEKPKMTKEKAIEMLSGGDGSHDGFNLALQFAIDFMKNTEEQGEIIGWANYFPESDCEDKWGSAYTTFISAKAAGFDEKVIQIPIRKPK